MIHGTPIKTLTLSGPDLNALGTVLMSQIIADLDAAGGAPLLLTGAGRAFSAGLHLKELASLEADAMAPFLELLERMVTALYRYPGPVAAAVNGHAIAGGCVLALCADYRVVGSGPKIRVGLNESALGVSFPPRTLRAVVSRLPRRHRDIVLLGAQLFEPSRALELGLVDAVSDDPVAEAKRWLERVAAHPAHAYADAKLRTRDPLELPAESWTRWVAENIGMWTGPDLRERIEGVLAR